MPDTTTPDAEEDTVPASGTKLVRIIVPFYGTARPGEIAELPAEIADMGIKAGTCVAVDKLDARLASVPTAGAGVRRWADPDGPAAVKTDLGQPERPPESGKGSGVNAWREYAIAQGMPADEAEQADKETLVAAYGDGDGDDAEG